MACLTQLIVVQFHQGYDSIIHSCQLYQGHLPIFWEKFECNNVQALCHEGLLQLRLLYGRGDVGQVEGGGRRVDVGVVFGTGFLEAVEV